MTTVPPALPAGEADGEFSPIENEPPLRWLRQLHLAPEHGVGAVRRAVFFALLTWLPIALWAFLAGRLLDAGTGEPLLQHYGVHVRCLLAIPLLVLAEAAMHSTAHAHHCTVQVERHRRPRAASRFRARDPRCPRTAQFVIAMGADAWRGGLLVRRGPPCRCTMTRCRGPSATTASSASAGGGSPTSCARSSSRWSWAGYGACCSSPVCSGGWERSTFRSCRRTPIAPAAWLSSRSCPGRSRW